VEAFLSTCPLGMLGHFFDGHELDDRHTVVVGDVTLTSRRVSHSVPTFGVRAEHGGPDRSGRSLSWPTLVVPGVGGTATHQR
jgi:hypothetical protein